MDCHFVTFTHKESKLEKCKQESLYLKEICNFSLIVSQFSALLRQSFCIRHY